MTTKTAPTPGPWTCPGTDDGEFVICHHDGTKRRTVAHAYTDANARLIAAAPELLEVLENIADQVDHADDCTSRHHGECICYVGPLQAALTTAKGTRHVK